MELWQINKDKYGMAGVGIYAATTVVAPIILASKFMGELPAFNHKQKVTSVQNDLNFAAASQQAGNAFLIRQTTASSKQLNQSTGATKYEAVPIAQFKAEQTQALAALETKKIEYSYLGAACGGLLAATLGVVVFTKTITPLMHKVVDPVSDFLANTELTVRNAFERLQPKSEGPKLD